MNIERDKKKKNTKTKRERLKDSTWKKNKFSKGMRTRTSRKV